MSYNKCDDVPLKNLAMAWWSRPSEQLNTMHCLPAACQQNNGTVYLFCAFFSMGSYVFNIVVGANFTLARSLHVSVFPVPAGPSKYLRRCIAPMVWAFLSTTVQLPATHRKVERGERDIQLVHVNEANSCLACLRLLRAVQARARRVALIKPPPPTHPLPMLNLWDFQRPRPKARTASI
jgi:hypothetical protein